MSKEQTPMEKQLKDWSPLKFNGEMKWRNEDVIKFAQAKVLEALERDKKFYCDNVTISRLRNTKTNAEWRRLVMNRFFAKQK